eukprot:1177000-Prorocentrum_minimum.AAC.6
MATETQMRDKVVEGNASTGDLRAKTFRKEWVISWVDLRATVQINKHEQKELLKGLTGHSHPGTLLAIMGPSGECEPHKCICAKGRHTGGEKHVSSVQLKRERARSREE